MIDQKKEKLILIPISIKQANDYVSRWHRHNKAVKIARFAVACGTNAEDIRGVAIFGLPLARAYMDGISGEILRVATDGTPNACSMLYGAVIRAAFSLGFQRIITYTLHSESGSSLKAVGFKLTSTEAGGIPWTSRPNRNIQKICLQKKNRWEIQKEPQK